MSALKKQFYPLGYTQQAITDWQKLRQNKGQEVQDCTHEFNKRTLMLGIPLYAQETLLTYGAGLHDYLRHQIFMFNPTNIDEVSVP